MHKEFLLPKMRTGWPQGKTLSRQKGGRVGHDSKVSFPQETEISGSTSSRLLSNARLPFEYCSPVLASAPPKFGNRFLRNSAYKIPAFEENIAGTSSAGSNCRAIRKTASQLKSPGGTTLVQGPMEGDVLKKYLDILWCPHREDSGTREEILPARSTLVPFESHTHPRAATFSRSTKISRRYTNKPEQHPTNISSGATPTLQAKAEHESCNAPLDDGVNLSPLTSYPRKRNAQELVFVVFAGSTQKIAHSNPVDNNSSLNESAYAPAVSVVGKPFWLLNPGVLFSNDPPTLTASNTSL